jgi:WD40 repeat protein
MPSNIKSTGKSWASLQTWVNHIGIAPDSSIVAAACIDRVIHLWDLDSGQPLPEQLKGHTNSVRCVAMTKEGNLLLSGADEGTVKIWDLKTFTCLDTLPGHKGAVRCLTISPDGLYALSGGDDGTVRLWSLADRKSSELPNVKHSRPVYCVAFSGNGQYALSGDEIGCLGIWTYEGGVLKPTTQLKGPVGAITGIAAIPDSDEIVTSCGDMTVRHWNIVQKKEVTSPWKQHTDSVQCIGLLHDGKHALSGSSDGTLRVWDVTTGQQVGSQWSGPEMSVETLAVAPDKQVVISGGASEIWQWKLDYAS